MKALHAIVLVILASTPALAKNKLCQVDQKNMLVTRGPDYPFAKSDGRTNVAYRMSRGDFYICNSSNAVDPNILQVPVTGNKSTKLKDGYFAHSESRVMDEDMIDSFKTPPEVFLSGSAGQSVSVLSQPGKTWQDVRDNSGVKAVAYPKVGSDQYKLFLKDLDYRLVLDSKGKKKLIRSAQVIMVENTPAALKKYKAGVCPKNDPQIKCGWVSQKNLQATAGPEVCNNCKGLEPPAAEDQIESLLKQLGVEYK